MRSLHLIGARKRNILSSHSQNVRTFLAHNCMHLEKAFIHIAQRQRQGSSGARILHFTKPHIQPNVSACNNQSRAVMEYWTWENPHRLTTFNMTLTYYQENSGAFQTALLSLIVFIQSNILVRTAVLREAWATPPESSSRPLPATLPNHAT